MPGESVLPTAILALQLLNPTPENIPLNTECKKAIIETHHSHKKMFQKRCRSHQQKQRAKRNPRVHQPRGKNH